MSRLIAFGCSNTWGQGLPDRIDLSNAFKHPYLTGSSYAWPALVAKKLNLEIYNYAVPGASNKEIWVNAINFDYQPSDIVVIMWTFTQRFCILTKENKLLPKRLAPWRDEKESKFYFSKLYDDFDGEIDSWLRVDHLNKTLKNKVSRIINLNCVLNGLKETTNWVSNKPHWAEVDMELLGMFEKIYLNNPRTACLHPGITAHKALANEILTLFNTADYP